MLMEGGNMHWEIHSEGEVKTGRQYCFFLSLRCLGCLLEDATPQLILSGNTLTDMPKMCLLGDAQTHLADTQVKLSHQVYVLSCLWIIIKKNRVNLLIRKIVFLCVFAMTWG